MKRRALLALAAAVLVAVAATPVGGQATSVGPEAVAWWSRTSEGPLAAPPPPDVPPDGMQVAGVSSDEEAPATAPPPGATADLPASEPDSGAVAIGAVRFTLPPDSRPDQLTLRLAEGSSGDFVLACATPDAFAPVANGSWSEVPAFDCTSSAVGTVADDGTSLTVDGLDGLVRGQSLGVVLLPIGASRLLLARPPADALTLAPSLSGPTLDPPPTFASPASGGSLSGPSSGGGIGLTPVPPATPAVTQPAAAPAAAPAPASGSAYATPAAAVLPGPGLLVPGLLTLGLMTLAVLLMRRGPRRYPVIVGPTG